MKSLAAGFLLTTCSLSSAAILIQDDFSNPVVGATRNITDTAVIKHTVSSANPLQTGSGAYLTTTVSGAASPYPKAVSYAPTSIANAWEGLAGSLTVNGTQYTTMQGSFNMIFRINSLDSIVNGDTTRWDTHFLRPVDLTGSVDTQALRLILEGTTTNVLSFSLNSYVGAVFGTNGTTFGATSRTISISNFSDLLSLNSVNNLGLTFDTNMSTGLITAKLFLNKTGGDILTSSNEHLLGSTSFYMSDTVARGEAGTRSIFGGAKTWDIVNRSTSTFSNVSIDYDSIQLQSGSIDKLGALLVPEPNRTIAFALGLFAFLFRRRR